MVVADHALPLGCWILQSKSTQHSSRKVADNCSDSFCNLSLLSRDNHTDVQLCTCPNPVRCLLWDLDRGLPSHPAGRLVRSRIQHPEGWDTPFRRRARPARSIWRKGVHASVNAGSSLPNQRGCRISMLIDCDLEFERTRDRWLVIQVRLVALHGEYCKDGWIGSGEEFVSRVLC